MPLQQRWWYRYQSVKTYRSLPRNVTQLDREMCGLTARTGQLCGQCMENCSLPVYSYYPQCVNCTGGTNNWAKYLAVSLLPTTAFFTGALVFRFRAMSPLLNGYILACQILTSPITTVHLWCGCAGPSSDALLVAEGSGTFKTHSWMPLQRFSSSPTLNI